MRALLLVLDSVGIGHAADAAENGDEGANTLGHILEQTPDLRLPNLCPLGLAKLVPHHRSYGPYTTYVSSHGRMTERSAGKDTTTGHWEMTGVILEKPSRSTIGCLFPVAERLAHRVFLSAQKRGGPCRVIPFPKRLK